MVDIPILDLERWLPCTLNDCYEVSNYGRVRKVKDRSSRVLSTKFYLKFERHRKGYLFVSLRERDGGQHKCYIHRLILLAFRGPRPEGFESRHLDCNKDNNCLSNLVYGTSRQNSQDSTRYLPKRIVSEEVRNNQRIRMKTLWEDPNFINGMTGKRHTVSTRVKISESVKDTILKKKTTVPEYMK